MNANSRTVLKTFWDWIAEVKALQASFDIPKDAFNLTFYSDASPEDTRKTTDLMQEAAAWQKALGEVSKSGWHAVSSNYSKYLWDPSGLAWQALQDISDGSSSIKCDFDMGDSVDPKQLYRGDGYWQHEKFGAHCAMHDSSSWGLSG